MLTKSLTINANRYVDILSVGSNVVTLTGMPSMTSSAASVQGEEESDLDTLLALTVSVDFQLDTNITCCPDY